MELNKLRIYFAHAVNTYGQPIEKAWLTLIAHCFPNSEIENPNQPHHQISYEEWKKRTETSRNRHSAMDYFYEEVLPALNGCVAAPFPDNRIGLGVAGETKKFILRNKPVWLIEATRVLTPTDFENFIKNPLNGLFRIRPFTDKEIALIFAEVSDDLQKINLPNAEFVIQHQETRLRTWIVYNKVSRPYEEAHLVKMSPDGKMPEGFYPEVPDPNVLKPQLSQ